MKSVRIISAAVLAAGIMAGICGCSGNTPAISGSMSVNSEESPAVSSVDGDSSEPETADSDEGSSERRAESVVENEIDPNDEQEDEYASLRDRLPQTTAAFERINRDEYSAESSEEAAAAELMDRNMIWRHCSDPQIRQSRGSIRRTRTDITGSDFCCSTASGNSVSSLKKLIQRNAATGC